MDADIAKKLGGLAMADLSALLAFMQSDLSRLAGGFARELTKINESIDVRATQGPKSLKSK